MAITAAFTTQGKADFLGGVHLSTDTYKMALYTSAATLDATTTTYSATNEVANGNGYTTGGATLSGFSAGSTGTQGNLTWTSPTWPASTITARGAVIYNTTRSNKVVAVLSFGASDIVSTNGTFTVTLPASGASGGTIQIS